MAPVIRTHRLLLRPLVEGDADSVVKACSDPEIALYIPLIPSPYELDDAYVFIAESTRAWKAATEATFAVVDAAKDEFLGIISVRLSDDGSVGYWIAPGARGRGLATEALRAVVDWARTARGVRRLWLTTHPANVASQRVAEKVGFRRRPGTVEHMPFRDGERRAFRYELGR